MTLREANARVSAGDTDSVGPRPRALLAQVSRRSLSQPRELRLEEGVEGSVAGRVDDVLRQDDVAAGAFLAVRGVDDGVPSRSPRVDVAHFLNARCSSNDDERVTALESTELLSPAVDVQVADLETPALVAARRNGGRQVAGQVLARVFDDEGRARVILWEALGVEGLARRSECDGRAVRVDLRRGGLSARSLARLWAKHGRTEMCA